MTALDGELDNVREALERLIVSRDGEHAALLAGAMGTYWFERGHVAEGQRWLTRALELTAGSRSLERGLALVALAETVSHFEDLARRLEELQEAVGIIREHGDDRQLLYALTHLASAHGFRGNFTELAAIRAEEAEIRSRFADPWLDAYALISASLERAGEGNLTDAHAGLRHCANAFLELGDETFAARVLMFAGILSHHLGELTAARGELGQSADLASRAGIRGTQAHAELTLALVAMELGDQSAESLFRGGRAIFEMVGDVRCAAVCTRSLGSLALDDDRVVEAVDLLRQSIDGLGADPPALAVAIADLATIYHRRGDTSDAIRLAEAAQVLARKRVATMWITAGERSRIEAAVKATQADVPTAGTLIDDDGANELEAVLDVARRH
jgi:tetratricopeptide (TPR) repeat protein